MEYLVVESPQVVLKKIYAMEGPEASAVFNFLVNLLYVGEKKTIQQNIVQPVQAQDLD
jgi:hypothetical protein